MEERLKFYGRIKSRALTSRQLFLYNNFLPDVLFTDFADLGISTNILEIGFGNGETLSTLALENPNKTYIGCEMFVNGIASLLDKIERNKIQNIKIFNGDARLFIKQAPNKIFDEVLLLFPDPWTKRKHHFRRFINDDNVLQVHRILREHGVFKIATDHAEYASAIIKTMQAHKNIFALTEMYDQNTRPNWPTSKYEVKSNSTQIMYAVYTAIH